MNWQQLLSSKRFKFDKNNNIVPTFTPSTKDGLNTLRTDFNIDYDRIVFSSSFRKLGRKTQVHPFADNDHIHNRLTHSIEVASVGRSIGNRVGIMLMANEELPLSYNAQDIGTVVQVACLAHDLGNPPFGHVGEEALRDWFKKSNNSKYLNNLNLKEKIDIQNYEGNAHTLRIIVNLEMYITQGGMRLSAASIGTLMKYPWASNYNNQKFNIYQTELNFIEKVFSELGIEQISSQCWHRHPLSYLMEAADDICYALIDLEDAVEIGLIDVGEVEKVLASVIFSENILNIGSAKQKCAILRAIVIGKAIDDISQTFIKHKNSLLQGEFIAKDLISVSSLSIREALEGAKQLAKDKIFSNKDKFMTEIASFPCLGSILSILIPAAYEYIFERSSTIHNELVLKLLENNPITKSDSLYNAYMKVLDYVGSLTDNAAAKIAREVSGIGMIR